MRRLVSCFLAVLMFLCLFGCEKDKKPDLQPEIFTFDVGQGSSTLIRTRDGDILVDAGSDLSQPSLCRRLRALGVDRLEFLILTHPDGDHIGGADGILEQFDVLSVWTNGAVDENDSYKRLTESLQKSGLTPTVAKAGDGFALGGLHVTVLAPLSETVTDDNEGSLVLLLRCDHFGGLIMGDVSEQTEQAMIEEYGITHLDIDVLWVGHHGSGNASSTAFLETISPQYAIISCGAGNTYGHPDGRTLARLESAGAEVLRTDLLGEIRMEIYENKICLADDQADENKGANR